MAPQPARDDNHLIQWLYIVAQTLAATDTLVTADTPLLEHAKDALVLLIKGLDEHSFDGYKDNVWPCEGIVPPRFRKTWNCPEPTVVPGRMKCQFPDTHNDLISGRRTDHCVLKADQWQISKKKENLL